MLALIIDKLKIKFLPEHKHSFLCNRHELRE